MAIAFIVFTFLAIPAMIIYSKGTGYQFNSKENEGDEIYSLGNLGYSSM